MRRHRVSSIRPVMGDGMAPTTQTAATSEAVGGTAPPPRSASIPYGDCPYLDGWRTVDDPTTPNAVRDIAKLVAAIGRGWSLRSWWLIDPETFRFLLRRGTAYAIATMSLILTFEPETAAAILIRGADEALDAAPRCNGCHCHSPEADDDPDGETEDMRIQGEIDGHTDYDLMLERW